MTNLNLTKDSIDVKHVNDMLKNSPDVFIKSCEEKYNSQLTQIAKYTAQHMQGKILLLSGPSASTKTTTANKLSDKINSMGISSVVISLDNFFVNREALPKLANGDPDFESINTLDLKTMDRCFDELVEKGHSCFPVFDFKAGKRSSESINISATDSSVVIVEGIHALHPTITSQHNEENFLKVFISPYSNYFLDDELLLSTRNIRLIRRIIRDFYHRRSNPSSTLNMWANVVASEIDNIIPYKKDANFLIDSTIAYEPAVYNKLFLDIIKSNIIEEKHKKKFDDLANILRSFVPLDPNKVPADTVIREFLI
ncbi:MAG: hypothetical protein RR497_02395 [Oscillospiraceae bacterium]